ncbi:MAG TPA: methyltransferase domain-containing protein, partial [Bryobacteraceae bacterium]
MEDLSRLQEEIIGEQGLPCPVCGPRGRTVLAFRQTGRSIHRCKECGVEFQYPQPSDAMLASIYTNDYFLGSEDEDARSAMEALKSATARLYLQWIKALVNAPAPRLLEIGCGSGDFLVEAQSNGFEVEGLEYSPHAVSTANARLSREAVRVGSLETSHLPASAYDVAAAFDVIEHLRDPVSSI